jgi:hypothetical protein
LDLALLPGMRAHPTSFFLAVAVLGLGFAGCRRGDAPPPPPTADASPVTPASPAAAPAPSPLELEAAVARIEETRSSAGGISTPTELRHYPDTRRFLSLQMADAQEAGIQVPHDDAELIEMIRAGKLVRLPPLTDTYLLYEVGEDAKDDPLVHYDAAANKDVPLLGSMEEVAHRAATLEAEGAKGRAARERLDAYYNDPARREKLFAEHQAVAAFASENGYDLASDADRARMHKDLLSYIRPEARDMLATVAAAYHQQFGRLLPVTSVIRTERYQRRLGGVNPNATRVDIPPHGTGEAFDISYRYMASDEQNFVMEQIAKLESEQKVEALRERRGHIHVYAFAGGDRPPEAMVAAALSMVDAARAERAEENRTVRKASARSRAKSKAAVKRTTRRAQRSH